MTNIVTNILAKLIVSLATNVVQSDNAVYEPDYRIAYLTNPITYGNRLKTPATERYVTTNVEQVTAIEWSSSLSSGRHEIERKMLSSVTAILKLKSDWEPAGIRTNSVPMIFGVEAATNWIRVGQ